MNYKKDRYGLHSIEKTEINALQLEEIPDSVISYKDKYAKISKDVCKDKYSFYKYMRQEDTILFRHERAEIYLKYDSCQEILFFKRNLHNPNDFTAVFSIHCILEPRPFQYYYFNYLKFFNFYYKYKRIYYNTAAAFLTDNDTDFYDSGKVNTEQEFSYLKGI